MENEKLREASKLLERWLKIEIPPSFWCQPGEDYILPSDTQLFLFELERAEKE